MKHTKRNIAVFDNGREILDRYTIIDLKSGDIYGASSDPFHPMGFGQHCGNPAWSYFTTTVGANFMRRIEKDDPKHYNKIIRQKTAEIVKEFKADGNIGKLISYDELPDKVKQYCNQMLAPIPA